MTSCLRRLARVTVVALVVMLTLLLRSGDRFALSQDMMAVGKEGQEGNSKDELKIDTELVDLNNVHSKLTIKTILKGKYNSTPNAGQPSHVSPIYKNEFPIVIGSKKSNEASVATKVPPPRKVLLLSSVGRSGSSFLGSLLAASGNTMYFFEPMRTLPLEHQTKEYEKEELIRVFQCKIRESIFKFGRLASLNVMHSYTRGKMRDQVNLKRLVQYCKKESLIIIKTIRMRLQWVQEVMSRKEVNNLKVIHLVRDPRGSIVSMEKLRWNRTYGDVCDKIHQDLQQKESMMSLYPSRYTFVTYEDLCRDPYGQSRRLLRFIYDQAEGGSNTGNTSGINVKPPDGHQQDPTAVDPAMYYQDLPKGILDFLSKHIHSGRGGRRGPFTTTRDTHSMYQRWRQIISSTRLRSAQGACTHVIRALGHRLFPTFAAVRNYSISLFDSESL